MSATRVLALLVITSPACSVWYPESAAAALFLAHTDYEASRATSAVVLGDLNNDGSLDITAVHANTDSLTVHLGNGDGTFQPKKTSWSITAAYGVAVGNVNGDMWLDVVLPWSDSIGFELGDGSGSFPSSAYALTGSVGLNGRVAVGDLNGDTHLDAVVTNDRDPGFVFIALGNGDGTFQPYKQFATGKRPADLAIADLNNDAKADLVVANTGCCPEETSISVLLGNGDGTFGARTDFTTCTAPISLAVADLDADGILDVVTSCVDTNSVLLGVGDGTLGPKSELSIARNPRSVRLADLNGDSKLDLAVVDPGYGFTGHIVRVALGNGDGTYAPADSYEVDVVPVGLAVGDLNADGRLDLVTANMIDPSGTGLTGSVSVLLNCSPCEPTTITASLFDAFSSSNLVRLRWHVEVGSATGGVVYRRERSTEWAPVGIVAAVEGSIVTYEDRTVVPGGYYGYRLMFQEGSEQVFTSEAWVAVPEEDVPSSPRIDLIRPNPTGQVTRIFFGVQRSGMTSLSVYDAGGRLIKRLVHSSMEPGLASAMWDSRDLSGRAVASGTYFIRLETNGQIAVRKVVVAR